jgi:hypothetical protein
VPTSVVLADAVRAERSTRVASMENLRRGSGSGR